MRLSMLGLFALLIACGTSNPNGNDGGNNDGGNNDGNGSTNNGEHLTN